MFKHTNNFNKIRHNKVLTHNFQNLVKKKTDFLVCHFKAYFNLILYHFTEFKFGLFRKKVSICIH